MDLVFVVFFVAALNAIAIIVMLLSSLTPSRITYQQAMLSVLVGAVATLLATT